MRQVRSAMDLKSGKSISPWNAAAYLCVGATMLLLLVVTGWGAYLDLNEIRETFLRGEVGRLRSHVMRTIGRIQEKMGQPGATLTKAISEDNWLRKHWERTVPSDHSWAYSAVADPSGIVVMHSDPTIEGGRIEPGWYDRVVPEAGDDVVETANFPLTGGDKAYDVRAPILVGDREVGVVHSGLDRDWFKTALAERNASTRLRWIGIFACMSLIGILAGVSLHQIVKRTVLLGRTIEISRVRQFAELGELAAGIAHEIRNPINAIRLNLHSLQRMQQLVSGHNGHESGGNGHESDSNGHDESATMIAETNQEIDRIEKLMRLMLGYARPEKPQEDNIDIRAELEATLHFLKPVMEREQIFVRMLLPPAPVYIRIDRSRLRQITMNLLNNAKDAVGSGGAIDVQLACRSGNVEIVVADNGPGVPPAERGRIFDPFYSTKELGTGLGLALVKRFTEEAQGTIVCESNDGTGARFRLSFPEAIFSA